MDMSAVVEATSRFNPSMGSKAERVQQARALKSALDAFIQAAIDLNDVLDLDCDAEDDDPAGCQHDDREPDNDEQCAHYQIDQTRPNTLLPWSMPMTDETIL